MTLDRILYLVPYVISALISFSIGWYAFSRRSIRGARSIAALAFLETEWTITFICQCIAATLAAKIFWNNAQFLGAIFCPLALLSFSLEYTNNRIRRSRLVGWIVSFIPLFILSVVWTDGLHHLWRIDPHLIAGTPFDLIEFQDGPLFMLYPLYGYTVLGFGTLLLLFNFLSTPRIYRLQVGAVLAGISFPWIVTLIAVTGIFPWRLHEATPIAFAMSNAIIGWGFFRFGLFNIIPVARELLIENLHDGVIVLDPTLQVIDYNPAARAILGNPSQGITKKNLRQEYPFLAEIVKDRGEQKPDQIEIELNVDGEARWFDMTISALPSGRNYPSGKLVLLHDVTEQKRVEKQLELLAMTDPLTGLYNRRRFFEMAELEIERCRRYRHSMSLILFDLDDFKHVNDQYGHRIGDIVLQSIARTYSEQLRDNDTLARYGGEEFIILLPESTPSSAYDAAERMRLIVANSPIETGQVAVPISVSMGVVSLDPEKPVGIDQLLERVDQALYQAKHTGRNRVCLWQEKDGLSKVDHPDQSFTTDLSK